MPERLSNWLEKLAQDLAQTSYSPRLDAQVLLAHIMQRKRSWVLAHPEAILSLAQEQALHQARQALLSGTPLPYVLGHWEFYGLDFIVSLQVLIPRPETELLVEQALNWLALRPGAQKALELGVGSGCIAVSLAVHKPDLCITAVDISPQALDIARANAHKHAVEERIHFVLSDLFNAVTGRFDLVCANLPYIPGDSLQGLAVAGYEPHLALDGGGDGLELIRRFLQEAPAYLLPGGLLLAEIEASQGAAAMQLAKTCFPGARFDLLQDLAGKDRLLRVENR